MKGMTENGRMVRNMALDYGRELRVTVMLVSGRWANLMVMVCIDG